ncbi:MAG: V-type ATP synthase subunit F [Acidihalobacter sp.]
MNAPRLIFLGDEASAAGLRLAGVETHLADASTAEKVYAEYASDADVLLLGSDVARGLPADQLERDLSAPRPLLLVLPALRGNAERDDPAELIRRRLGIRDDSTSSEEQA